MDQKFLIEEVKKIILKHCKPERIYLYGSQATGEAGATSDLDIAYDDKDCPAEGPIEAEVQNLPTLMKIDVKNIAHTEERFRNRVKATGRVLYSATKRLRFEDGLYNFRKASERFSEAVERREEFYREGYGDIYLDLAVKRFEFTYEMSWKAIRRYLDYAGLEALSPRECFKEAFAQGLIRDQGVWLNMIEQRNLTSHMYSHDEAAGLLTRLEEYRKAFAELLAGLEQKMSTSDTPSK